MNSLVCGALVLAVSMVPAWAGGADPVLDARVRSALHRDLGPDAHGIRVDSYGGTVRLAGSVGSHRLWVDAQESAVDVQGVNHVLNVMDHGGDPASSVQ